jgi:hypothetical protein|tara:strand:+ start:819 stop:1091 length:273 start_codon:yes stop_codon:yes gene_type:complete
MPEISNEIMDMIIADESPAAVSDKIKDILFAKSSSKVDAARPNVAADTFGSNDETPEETPSDETVVANAVADAAANISGEVAADNASTDQ